MFIFSQARSKKKPQNGFRCSLSLSLSLSNSFARFHALFKKFSFQTLFKKVSRVHFTLLNLSIPYLQTNNFPKGILFFSLPVNKRRTIQSSHSKHLASLLLVPDPLAWACTK